MRRPVERYRIGRYMGLLLLGLALALGGALGLGGRSPAVAQLPPVVVPRVPLNSAAAEAIHAQFPDLPLENQYIDRTTGDVAASNTLVRRLINYHLLVKGRPPFSRLDWKLTLADYLGANELMFQANYPGAMELRTNPLAGDRAAIAQLTRQQRNDLVLALVLAFNPDYGEASHAAPASEPVPEPSAPPTAAPEPDPQLPALPQPGDADLLRF
jgi:hypothetical protein